MHTKLLRIVMFKILSGSVYNAEPIVTAGDCHRTLPFFLRMVENLEFKRALLFQQFNLSMFNIYPLNRKSFTINYLLSEHGSTLGT